MSSKFLFPAMDTDGWVNSPTKVADYLITHFFLSDYSQTANFPDNVASFAWILQHYQSDLVAIQSETQQRLTRYFSSQFENVEVVVTEEQEEDSINNHGLIIYLSFRDTTGTEHNLSRIIRYDGMKVTNVIAVINKG